MVQGKENKRYTSSVFADLFFEDITARANDIELYNALHEEQLPPETQVTLVRIEDILYMNFKNDISFGIQDKVMVFGEHQSTINYNMPLRGVMYVGRAYEQIVDVKDRYKKGLVKIPTPEFYTFYNGKEKFNKEMILRLSDAYRTKEEKPMLDLIVKVININPEESHEVLERCPVLKEYGIFVDTVRKYQAINEPEAIKAAIHECITKGVLVEYLNRKGSQVNSMLVAEYDYDLDIQVQREEAAEEAAIKAELNVRAECILELLQEMGNVNSDLTRRIKEENNPDTLKKWLKLAVKAESIQAFKAEMQ
ncbi:MAG: hypothetical protein RR869_09365 [Lachnospiraceae bacterium]